MIGFLHTAEVHTATFNRLLDQAAPGTPSIHVVDASLLADAQARGGVDAELQNRITARLREVAATAEVVVCTCSTIGGSAESLAGDIGVPVVRVDRPMAERAVAMGPRIAVVAALVSTIGPTTELLRAVAAAADCSIDLVEVVCEDAWSMFQAGETDGYLAAIAQTVDALDVPVDVIVLAQASMAGAADRVRTSIPILSSPRLAVETAVSIAAALATE